MIAIVLMVAESDANDAAVLSIKDITSFATQARQNFGSMPLQGDM